MKKTLQIILLIISLQLMGQVQKLEPHFWWEGMKHSSVQLMFYGKNIAQYKIESPKDLPITGTVKTENPNYQFVTIDTRNTRAGKYEFKFLNDKNKVVFTKVYEIKPRKENSALRQGFNSSDLVYLLMPDRFANGDSGNDSHPDTNEKFNRKLAGGRHGGDITGIINHLDYIKDLGATAIWSTPLLEDNEITYSYHGYACSDLYKIDPRYGTNNDYLKLSAELHQRGMKLIKDFVPNHWGLHHWMIQDLPTNDWIHKWESGENGFQRSNYRQTVQFDPNVSDNDAEACIKGWFDTTMPDINQRNPLALNYLIQNAIWWIEYADLDGIRVDTYSYNDKDAIALWTKAIMDEYPNFNIVGEIWMHDQAQIAYWQKDSQIGAIQHYNSHLPSVMDFTLHDALSVAFLENEANWDKGIIKVYENFINDFMYPDINNILVFAENHDTNRIIEQYKGDFKKYQQVMVLIATVRGIPQIYYGSEIGMRGDKGVGDADIRRDFPGGWKEDKQNAFTADGRTAEQKKYHDFTSKLFNWRKEKSVIHSGKTTHYIPEENVYVYFRHNEQESVMVIINNSNDAKTINPERFEENIKNSTTAKDIFSGKQVSLKNEIKVDGNGFLVMEIL